MGLINNYGSLLRYKLQYVGLRNTVRVAYLDLWEQCLYQLAKRFPALSTSPRSIQIECTTRCNLKCTFCELSYWTEKPADLKFENIQKMVEHLPKLQRIDLTGIGEALMNPEFFKIVGFLKSRGIYVTLNDNFTLMSEKTARQIVELGIDQIFLSLDGATKETYEQLRRGSNFERVIFNARRLVEVKREMGKKLPEFKINTVVCLANCHELPALVEIAHDLGIGMIQFVNVITFEDTTSLSTQALPNEIQQHFQAAVRRANELGVLVKIELFDKLPVQQCDFPWTRNFVTQDGYVHPCCYTTQSGDRQAQNQRSLGNLLHHSFAELWDGEVYSAFRQKIAEGTLPYQCEQCPKYFGKPDASFAQDFVQDTV
jgi:pyrroloquinoline quinone biosynthesis protein E